MTRWKVALALLAAVVLFAISPAFQGYHLSRQTADTTCTTRFLLQFCKDESARLAHEAAAKEAQAHKREAAEEAAVCKQTTKEAEAGRWATTGLPADDYYTNCLPPALKHRLVAKYEANAAAEATAKRQKLEAEAAKLRGESKTLTEEQERLSKEGKSGQSLEKLSQQTRVEGEANAKEKEVREAGG
jgi:hypothetical protein